MQFWLVSPNIDMKGGRTLENWKEIILGHHAVFMGWPPKRSRDGRQRLGGRFAGTDKNGIDPGDLILSAFRENWGWRFVACGSATKTAVPADVTLEDGYSYRVTRRNLRPFKRLQDDPNSKRLSMKGTTADGRSPAHPRRVVPALVKFKPETNPADKQLLDKLMKLLKVPPEQATPDTTFPEDGYLRASGPQRKIILRRHNRLSNAFAKWLTEHGYRDVRREEGCVDVDFRDGTTTCRAELKVCYGVKTRQAIREALGQLLEYNYYPHQYRKPAKKCFVVLDERPTDTDMRFLKRLCTAMKLPLSVCWRSGNAFQKKTW
ncbi:MAG: hypothetical protein LAO04_12155 [Acidobacteriia bacterium]|nr:hypothetical protein [Terriglobia bacterium]